MATAAVIGARKVARDEADEIVGLALDFSRRCQTADEREVFWMELRDHLMQHFPYKSPQPIIVTKAKPMTDAEAKEFGKVHPPFGQYADWAVDSIPVDYLRWLADQTFVDDLRRYLANETISRS